LPARELKLALDGFPADGKARVGQPITLTMRLDAVGLPFEALPALSLPKIDGADVYPDKAVTGSSTSGPWITGRRQQGFAVVPTREGTLHIPETTLHWWNVATDKAETATLPARDITVGAGNGMAAPTPPVGASSATTNAPANAATVAAHGSAGAPAAAGVPWRWIAAGLAALWLLTVVAWVAWARRRRRPPPAPFTADAAAPARAGPAREQFLKAAESGDLPMAERTLVAWARAERPAVRTLGELAAALQPGRQRDAIAALQRARFAGEAGADVRGLREAFAGGFDWLPAGTPPGRGGLPPLYPR
jgi:hypothetical protein